MSADPALRLVDDDVLDDGDGGGGTIELFILRLLEVGRARGPLYYGALCADLQATGCEFETDNDDVFEAGENVREQPFPDIDRFRKKWPLRAFAASRRRWASRCEGCLEST